MSAPALEDELVAELARAAVERAAPEELPLFRATSEAYLNDPTSIERSRSGDEMLGFGVEAAVVLVTPVALAIARDVVGFVVEQVRGHAREAGAEAIDRVANRILRRKEKSDGDTDDTPELNQEQLEQVRALAVEKARALKVPPEKAQLLADALVGSLAIA